MKAACVTLAVRFKSYNIGLSIRHANAVRAELIRNGVPENAIIGQGFGPTHLLVPTHELAEGAHSSNCDRACFGTLCPLPG
jgi:outer membrane protein OmpA-like peptidoglycan-associated protein